MLTASITMTLGGCGGIVSVVQGSSRCSGHDTKMWSGPDVRDGVGILLMEYEAGNSDGYVRYKKSMQTTGVV